MANRKTVAAKKRVAPVTPTATSKPRVAPSSQINDGATARAMLAQTTPMSLDPVPPLDAGHLIGVVVPKNFRLTDDSHAVHEYAAGTTRMPKKHAEHPYSEANGVTIAK